MRPLLNTLFVTRPKTRLRLEGECVHVQTEGKTLLKQPLCSLESIVCFGRTLVSPVLMGFCSSKGISIVFLSVYGRFLARVYGPVSGNILLRRQQYRSSEDKREQKELAQCFIEAKLANSVNVLARFCRDHKASATVKKSTAAIKTILRRLALASTVDELRGLEGQAAVHYFSVFDQLILTNKKTFHFESRKRRPPPDPVNCLLSFVYTVLRHLYKPDQQV